VRGGSGEWARFLCSWVDGHLDQFTPWHGDGETTPSSLQRFAELAIAYDVVTTSPVRLPSPDDLWRPFITQQVSRAEFAELARSHLDMASALLLPYLVLRRHGERNEYHEATLAAAQAASFPSALEVVPYRALDYAYFAQRSGLPAPDELSISALLSATYAARASCAYLVTDESAYALTHTAFYASDFGQTLIQDPQLSSAAAIIDSMIVDCVIRRHYDLLGELLIASTVLPGTRPELREIAVPIFFSTLDDSGSLMPNEVESTRTFDICYHTTMVGLILCASLAKATSEKR